MSHPPLSELPPPLGEVIIAAISGEGGLLYWISKGLTDAMLGNDASDLTFPSPTKAIVSPLTKVERARKSDLPEKLAHIALLPISFWCDV